MSGRKSKFVAGAAELDRAAAQKRARVEFETYLRERAEAKSEWSWYLPPKKVRALPSIRRVMASPRIVQGEFFMIGVRRAIERAKATIQLRERVLVVSQDDLRDVYLDASQVLIGRAMPLESQDLVVILGARRAELLSRWRFPIGSLLRTIQGALNGQEATGSVRTALVAWRKSFSVGYGSDLASLRARLDQIIDPNGSSVGVTWRNVKTTAEAVQALTQTAREASQVIPAGRALRMGDVNPTRFLARLNVGAALDALVKVTIGLIGVYGDQKDHPARYMTNRPGFARVKDLAPEFCSCLRVLFLKVVEATEAELLPRFEWYYIGHSKTAAANRLIECLYLEGLPRARLFELFRMRLERDNSRTDCPVWGDSFEPIADEAEGPQELVVLPGDAWANAALADLREMERADREAWVELLRHCDSVEWSKPSKGWMKKAGPLVAAAPDFAPVLTSWLRLIGKRGTRMQNLWGWPPDGTYLRYRNARTLRALIWAATFAPTQELAAAIGDAAVACDQKVLRLGPRNEIVRNAAIGALSTMPGEVAGAQVTKVSLLAKYKTSRKLSGRALRESAEREQVAVEEFMEIGVPDYGFGPDHAARRGGGELRITGGARVEFEGDLKDEAREVERLLSAHRVRLERLLWSGRSWTEAVWRNRYGDHPLLSYMSRRLIWRVGERAAMWNGERWSGADGKAVRAAGEVRPWHPAACEAAEVLAWREALHRREIVQPFKQAYREVYLLTDAERRTRTYSNRFASHILRGPQFRALLHERGWSGDPTTAFDSALPASLDVCGTGLTAFLTTASGEEPTDRGFFARVSTDRVEFKRGEEAVKLEEVPRLAFSEVMRDVDLFVGVSSVGVDPNWHDGGPDGNHQRYWQEFAFGELSESGRGRAEVLRALLPRLKIAGVCEVAGRFLKVKGKLRSYKIHLGSGNILMEPNDQYLCIVPGRDQERRDVYLPFEGDRTLAIILSKAFMLAADDEIRDMSIVVQITRKS